MIVQEFYITRDDGVDLYRTYSDSRFFIIQNETGAKYEEAIDVAPVRFTYSETNELIPIEPEEE